MSSIRLIAYECLTYDYATESQKGHFIGIFWTIFNLGGVVGASVSLGQNFHSEVRLSIHPVLCETNAVFHRRLAKVCRESLFAKGRNAKLKHIKVGNGTYVGRISFIPS